MGPLKGTESLGWRLKPSSSLSKSMCWQSDVRVVQSGFGRLTRSPVFWLASPTVKRSDGNGLPAGSDRSNIGRTPAAAAGATCSTAQLTKATPSIEQSRPEMNLLDLNPD